MPENCPNNSRSIFNNKSKRKSLLTKLKKYNTNLTNELGVICNRCNELDLIAIYLFKIVGMTIRSDRISLHGLISLRDYFKLISSYNLLDVSDIMKRKSHLRNSTILEIIDLIVKKIEADETQ